MPTHRRLLPLLLLLLLLSLLSRVSSTAPPPPLFNLSGTLTSSMVLQRAPARASLWGWGLPGTLITLTGPGEEKKKGQGVPVLRRGGGRDDGDVSTTVDAGGRWFLSLPPQPAGPAFGSGNLTITGALSSSSPSSSLAVVLSDVLFGEVWMCTGQSNMGISLGGVGAGPTGNLSALRSWSGDISDGAAEVASAGNYPFIRVAVQVRALYRICERGASRGSGALDRVVVVVVGCVGNG